MNRRERAQAFVAAVRRQRMYAPTGDSCVTCFEVRADEVSRRYVFAEALDLGLALGDGLEHPRADELGALDMVVRVGGAPFCEVCAALISGYVAGAVMHVAPPACVCAAIPSLVDAFTPAGLGPWAFTFGLVFGDECKRCDVCRAMARGYPTKKG